jgi:hypothetical protein
VASGARLALTVSDDLWERDLGHDVGESWGVVDLYWIPLGAGAHVVRVSGKVFEAVSAFVQRRGRCDLYHSALVVHVPPCCRRARAPARREQWPGRPRFDDLYAVDRRAARKTRPTNGH